MDIEHYKRRLLEEHQRLVELTDRTKEDAREAPPDPIHDRTDGYVLGELKDELFKEADTHRTMLRRVRAALQRIADGTYGRCLVDGERIEPARLEAAPWAEYCVRHAQEREQFEGTRTPGLWTRGVAARSTRSGRADQPRIPVAHRSCARVGRLVAGSPRWGLNSAAPAATTGRVAGAPKRKFLSDPRASAGPPDAS